MANDRFYIDLGKFTDVRYTFSTKQEKKYEVGDCVYAQVTLHNNPKFAPDSRIKDPKNPAYVQALSGDQGIILEVKDGNKYRIRWNRTGAFSEAITSRHITDDPSKVGRAEHESDLRE